MHFRFDFSARSGFEALRADLRDFLAKERAEGSFQPRVNSWTQYDAGFTRRAAERGFIGLTFPKEYGGRGGTKIERFIVCEEMLAAGAPVGMHWIADRQSGPQILAHGSARAKSEILPRIAAGTCCMGIGMSEPGAGSDLAAVRTRATRVEGGWRITGTKLWTSHAHRADYIIALVRSGDPVPQKHAGLSQMIIDMRSPGVQANPITDMSGARDFNEVALEDVFVPDDFVLGEPGSGWKLVTGELAYERSGPERFMSNHAVLEALFHTLKSEGADPRARHEFGRLIAHLTTLRGMSNAVAHMLEDGLSPDVEAALVKDLGNAFEKETIEATRRAAPRALSPQDHNGLTRALSEGMLASPSYTLRGGTREILRSIVARQLTRA